MLIYSCVICARTGTCVFIDISFSFPAAPAPTSDDRPLSNIGPEVLADNSASPLPSSSNTGPPPAQKRRILLVGFSASNADVEWMMQIKNAAAVASKELRTIKNAAAVASKEQINAVVASKVERRSSNAPDLVFPIEAPCTDFPDPDLAFPIEAPCTDFRTWLENEIKKDGEENSLRRERRNWGANGSVSVMHRLWTAQDVDLRVPRGERIIRPKRPRPAARCRPSVLPVGDNEGQTLEENRKRRGASLISIAGGEGAGGVETTREEGDREEDSVAYKDSLSLVLELEQILDRKELLERNVAHKLKDWMAVRYGEEKDSVFPPEILKQVVDRNPERFEEWGPFPSSLAEAESLQAEILHDGGSDANCSSASLPPSWRISAWNNSSDATCSPLNCPTGAAHQLSTKLSASAHSTSSPPAPVHQAPQRTENTDLSEEPDVVLELDNLVLIDSSMSWYQKAGCEDAVQRVIKKVLDSCVNGHQYDEVLFLGSSMGGVGAIMNGCRLAETLKPETFSSSESMWPVYKHVYDVQSGNGTTLGGQGARVWGDVGFVNELWDHVGCSIASWGRVR